MKSIIFIFAVLLAIELAFAQSPSPPKLIIPAPAAAVLPTVTSPTVQVAESAAPPEWVQKLIVTSQGLPVVGPIVTKVILYGGMLASILTLVAGTLMALLKILSGISSLSGLIAFANKVEAFQNGKVMYWLKYLSMFNAKKPYPGEVIQPLARENA